MDSNNGWAAGSGYNSTEDYGYGIILKTTTGGNNWSKNIIRFAPGLDDIHFIDLNTGWAVDSYSTILTTRDGGNTWNRQASGANTVFRSVHFLDASTGWVVGSNGIILKTTSGGRYTAIDIFPNELPPAAFSLFQNYPNPFNARTKINYSIPQESFVTLKIYDILGREITTLVNQKVDSGNYAIEFDGSYLSSGVYFYRMQADNFYMTKKLIVLK